MKNTSVNLASSNSILCNPIAVPSNPMLLLYLLRLCFLPGSHNYFSLLRKPYSLISILKLYEESYAHACQRRRSQNA